MNVELERALDEFRGAWRFRRSALVATAAAALLGWLVVLGWPDSFEASARVFVNTSTALRPLLQGIAVDQDVDAQLNMVRESLLGRPRLERVIRDADLDLKAQTPEQVDRLIARLQKQILIDAQAPKSPGRETKSSDSVYTITYRNQSRDKALAVVRSLLNALMEDMVAGKRAGAGTAEKFLGEQIKDYEHRLSDAETKLAEFKKKNVGLVPGEQGDYFQRLQNEMLASKKAQSVLEGALRRRAELEKQLQGEKPFVPAAGKSAPGSQAARAAADGGAGMDTATRIADTQARLAEALLRYTDKHPDVISLKETLSQLQARQVAELEALKHGDAAAAAKAGLLANPVYQATQVQINQTDVEIAALKADLDDHQKAEEELRRLLNTAPEVEAEFARLMRDYTVEKAQYAALVDRLEKARLSSDASDTGIIQFQIINPPTSDLDPVAPNRLLLLPLVLLGALGFGVVFAWLRSQIRPVFSNTRTLADLTGLPVLGSVRMSWRERYDRKIRRSRYKLIGALTCLLLLFGAVMLFSDESSHLLHRLIQL